MLVEVMKGKGWREGRAMHNKKSNFFKNIWRLLSLQKAFRTLYGEQARYLRFWHTCKCSPRFHSINPSFAAVGETGWREINKCLTVLVVFTHFIVLRNRTFELRKRPDGAPRVAFCERRMKVISHKNDLLLWIIFLNKFWLHHDDVHISTTLKGERICTIRR